MSRCVSPNAPKSDALDAVEKDLDPLSVSATAKAQEMNESSANRRQQWMIAHFIYHVRGAVYFL